MTQAKTAEKLDLSKLVNGVMKQNQRLLPWIGLGGGVLQALALWAMRSLQVSAALHGCAWAGVAGLLVISLFAFQKRRSDLKADAIQTLNIVFCLWYGLTDGLIGYLAAQMPGGWYLPAGMLLLTTLVLPCYTRTALWLLYGLITVISMGGHPLLPYGLVLVGVCAVLSWRRWWQGVQMAMAQTNQQGTEETNRQLNQTLASVSTLDAETGVANRRAMSTWLEAVWPLCVRNRIPVEIIIVGGQKTAELAEALKPMLRRQSDYLGRFDDQTFVILYSGPSREDAAMLLNRVREAVQPVEGAALFAGFMTPQYRMVAAQALTWCRQEWDAMVCRGENGILRDYSSQ